ncbi:MAG: hypothetical protein JWN93_497 [Hyphomicrobiales bacterium]|nr:hypothetical protein [Hyphomicrobiales bacterium]
MTFREKPAPEQRLAYYQSLESMEGMGETPAQATPSPFNALPKGALLYAIYPGVLAAGIVAIAASWLSQNYHAPVMLFALLLGMALSFLHEEGRCVAGINFSARTILRLGVALLGLRISGAQIMHLGATPIVTVVAGVATTIAFGYWLSQRMGLGRQFGFLSGGAVAICGASAALAISSALPPDPRKERDTVLTVVGVTTLSTVAMILYPSLANWMHLTPQQSGLFIGGTIHDVAQVVGAGYMMSQETGDVSTYVKLLRVALLVPVVLLLSAVVMQRHRARRPGEGWSLRTVLPTFLLAFCALVLINTFLTLPAPLTAAATNVSNWCLVTAIAALGMKTNLREIAHVGWKPVALMVAETAWIAGLVLASIKLG